MKNSFLLLSMVFIGHLLFSQNLVGNRSFETREPGTNCPNTFSEYWHQNNNGRPQGWFTPPNFRNANPEIKITPDFFHPCVPSGGDLFPGNNTPGNESPLEGGAYAGFVGAINQSTDDLSFEYIYHQIPTSLSAGVSYKVEFWVSLSENSRYAIKTLGAYITKNVFDFSNGFVKGLHHLTPQIPNSFPSFSYYTNKDGWTKISGTFTPTQSGTHHIAIGNFDSQVHSGGSPRMLFIDGSASQNHAYYYIDMVTVAKASQCTSSNVEVNGSSAICSGQQKTYTINNLPSGSTVKWTKSSNLTFVGGSTGSTATLKASSPFGLGWVQAVITNGCGAYVSKKEIWVGDAFTTSEITVSGAAGVCSGTEYVYTANLPLPYSSEFSYSWT